MVTSTLVEDIQKEVLGQESLDKKNVNEAIGFIEAKQMARDEVFQPAVTPSVFSQKSLKTTQKPNGKIACSISNKSTDNFVCSSKT